MSVKIVLFLIQGKLKVIQVFVVGKLFSISPTSEWDKNEKIIGNDKKTFLKIKVFKDRYPIKYKNGCIV